MNAITQPQANALMTAEERSFELYAEDYMTPGRFTAWLEVQSAGGHRKQSHFWGTISNLELIEVLLKDGASGEQLRATMRELKDRFISEHCAEIAELETNSRSWPIGHRDDIENFSSGPLVLDGERRGV